MLAALAAYGPHASGQWNGPDLGNGPELALGRRQFRSLPEDRHDVGVVALDDGGRMVADTRLDNRPDLERRLGIDPSRARRLADSSILAAAWSRWREDCFDQLVGDYAFAVWDAPRRRLILARDPFGHRPLHFHQSRRLIAFASMPGGLHVLEDVPAAPDEDSLAAFLALAPEDGSGTFFAGVERVEPGGLVVLGPSDRASRRHYRPARRAPRLSGPAEYAEALRERLDEAVSSQLRGAEGGVGAHLSSGWDSGAVAATAARLLAPLGGRVTAFTAAPRAGYAGAPPPGRHGDESSGAARIAALHANIDHVILRGARRSPLDDMDRDLAFNGRPALNPCNHVWFNDINRAARTRGLTVVLTGDFGNLGLTDDGLDALPDLIGGGNWLQWVRLATAAARTGAMAWPGILAASFERHLPAVVSTTARRLLGRTIPGPAAWSALRPELRPKPASPRSRRQGDRIDRHLGALTRMDLALYAKGALASFGVDVRDPLTDRRLFEFCLSAPVEQLTGAGGSRALARRALADRLPAAILDQRTRGYQAIDWHEGLTADRATVAREVERLAALPAAARLLDIDRLRSLVARWPADDQWHRDEVVDSYRGALLRGLAVGRFLTRTLRAN